MSESGAPAEPAPAAASDAAAVPADEAATNKRSPSDFLKAVLGRPVNVRLNSGTDYKGKERGEWHNGESMYIRLLCVCKALFLLSPKRRYHFRMKESLHAWMGT